MKTFFKFGCLSMISLIVLAIFVSLSNESWGIQGTAELVRVVDGNTLEMKIDGEPKKIDLALIETPDLVSDDPYAQKAVQRLKKISDHGDYQLYYKANKGENGNYIGFVGVEGEVNLGMVQEGWAKVKVPKTGEWDEDTVQKFLNAQSKAKKAKKGIWKYDGYVKKDGYDKEVGIKAFEEEEAARERAEAKAKKAEEEKKKRPQMIEKQIKETLDSIKDQEKGKISSIHFEGTSGKKWGEPGNHLNVTVYVNEEFWASSSRGRKSSFVHVNGYKIEREIDQLGFLDKGTSVTNVIFRSDEVKDRLAVEKIGDGWKIKR
ncbi:thermonuclease family protein [Paludifilum halophilum]|uniref:TNase-like domain-containing protein n=1 Tax=Paludifilum halophilum TaxID=1642702 RepID=A0A235BBA2_9BACL|nr:thermonuclease family protein [Paludifilum halophilum]OYD09588.1 hypothetical protein CHM34_00810 [Paludifilum halophilum]